MGHTDHHTKFIMQELKRGLDKPEVCEHRVDHTAALQDDDPGIIAHQQADHKG